MNETSVKQNPYVGLKPFDEENSRYFFGRDEDKRIAANNLRAASVTIYYGASGVGKTSLINAGVIPYLRNVATASIPGKKPEFILVVLRDWINDPLESLRNRIKSAVEEAFAKIDDEEKAKLTFTKEDIEKEYVKNKQNGNLIRLLKDWHRLTKIKFLIIFDQFEIFLSDTESKPEYKTGKNSFGDEFAKVLNAADLPANFMISLRDDALSQMDFLKDKAPDLMKNTLRLEHLDLKAARDAIVRPLEQYNSENENSSFEISEELVQILLEDLKVGKINFDANSESDPNQIQSNTSNDKIETPFLQLVMNRLWQEVKDKTEKSEQLIDLDTLNKFKGAEEPNPVKHIVKTYLDEVMSSFTEAQKIAASKFIHFTVSSSGAKRSSTVEDLAKYTDKKISEAEIRMIMKELAGDKRVFKEVENRIYSSKPFYEVTHDAVVPAILSWRDREYQKIEQQEKLAEEEKLRLEQEAKLKDQEKRLAEEQKLRLTQEQLLAESQKNRRLGRRIWLLFWVLTLIVIWAAGTLAYEAYSAKYKKLMDVNNADNIGDISYQEQLNKYLDDKKETYTNQISNERSIIEILLDLQSEDSSKADKAFTELTDKAENGELPEEYKDQFEKLLNKKTALKGRLKSDKKVIRVIAPKSATPEPIAPAIIYIQFQNEDDRLNALNLRSLLNKQNGFLAPDVDNVGDHPEITNIQLRYFRGDDKDKILNRVSDCLTAIGIADVKLVRIQGKEDSPSIRQNQFELWFTSQGIPNIDLTLANKCSAAAN